MEMQTERTDLWTQAGGRKEKVRQMERVAMEAYTLPYVK